MTDNFSGQTQLLRRRKDDNPFNFASRTLGNIKDNIENVTKKVTIDNIASQVAQVTKKREEKKVIRHAPEGVTQSFSVVLTHVLAPLWSVGSRQQLKAIGEGELSADRIAEVRENRNLKLRDPRYYDFARRIDNMGVDLEKHAEYLQADESLATFFIVMLIARLMCIENGNGEYMWPSYLQLVDEVDRRDKKSVSDLPDTHANDETAVHGQAQRKLTEVGGSWKPPGAVELPPHAHAMRHKVLTTLYTASVCLKYTYNDDHVQCLCDSLCQQLKLLTYSETIVPLVAGIKGPQYVAKYILFQCPAPSSLYVASDDIFTSNFGVGNTAAAVASGILSGLSGGLLGNSNLLNNLNNGNNVGLASVGTGGAGGGSIGARSLIQTPSSGVASVSLQEITNISLIALQNFVHRNDTSDILVSALAKAIATCPDDNRTSLFVVAAQLLEQIYCVDVRLLAHVMDLTKPYIMQKAPTGPHAMKLITALSDLMRNAVCLPRRQLSSVFVAGKEARSFRLQPVHLLTSPYCSRAANFISSLNLAPIGLAHSPSSPMLPMFGKPSGSVAKNFVDDSTLYVANQCVNIFQALLELSDGNPKVESMDLGRLFAIPPHVLCRYYPALHALLLSATTPPAAKQTPIAEGAAGGAQNLSTIVTPTAIAARPSGLTVPSKTPAALVERIYDLYLTVIDQTNPERGQKQYRLESPWEPFLPTFINVCTEMDDMNATVMHIMEKHWKYCDGRITEKDSGAAFLHPQRDLSLSHFIETDIRLVVAGGSGTFRHVIGAILQLQNMYPGSLLRPKIYILPFGYDNCVASWLALRDPIWASRVHCPLLAEASPTVDPPSVEAMLNVGGVDNALSPSAAASGGASSAASINANVRGPPTSVKAFMLRNAINDYLLHAKEENKVIAYQAECISPDGTTVLVPFCCNLEIGSHVNNAVRSDPTASSMLKSNLNNTMNNTIGDVSAMSFANNSSIAFGGNSMLNDFGKSTGGINGSNASANPPSAYTANSFVGSMAKSFMNGVNALAQNAGSMVAGAGNAGNNINDPSAANGKNRGGSGDGENGPTIPRLTNYINFGAATKSDRIDRILIGLHGNRGPRLATLKGFNGQDCKHCAVGRDLLDWVSTTYHVFASEEALAAAQSLLDNGLFLPASWTPNTDPMRFSEKHLYTLCPREANDSQPLTAPCSRGLVMDNARMLLNRYVDLIAVKEGFKSVGGGGNGDGEEGAESGSPNGSPGAVGGGSADFAASMAGGGSPLGNSMAAGMGGASQNGGGGTFGSGAGGPSGAFGLGSNNVNLVPTMRCRVSFAGRKGDLRYTDIDEGIALDNASGANVVAASLVEAHGHGGGSPHGKNAPASHANNPAAAAAAAANALLRDVVSIKLRSTGAPGDRGSAPNPTVPTLHMAILQPDRKRLSANVNTNNSSANNNGRNGSDLGELFDHYQLNFGDRRSSNSASTTAALGGGAFPNPNASASTIMVDTNTVLTIEHVRAVAAAPTGRNSRQQQSDPQQNDVGLVVSADGDLFGPFVSIRVKPVTINLGRGTGNQQQQQGGRSASANATGGAANATNTNSAAAEPSAYKPAATVAVMSYMKLPSVQDAIV